MTSDYAPARRNEDGMYMARTRLAQRSPTPTIAAFAVLMACGTAPDAPRDASTDAVVEPDGGSGPSAAERAACSNVATLCGLSSVNEGRCNDALVSVRGQVPGTPCRPQFDAWVACMNALSMCPSESRVCPEEYSLLGMCVNP